MAHLGTLGRTSSGCPKARCSLEPIFSKDWDKAFRDEQSPETSRNIQKHPNTTIQPIQQPPHAKKTKYCEWLLYSCMNIICIREEGKAVDTSRSRPPTLHLFLIATVNGLQLLPTSFSLLFLRSYLVLQPKFVLNNMINI